MPLRQWQEVQKVLPALMKTPNGAIKKSPTKTTGIKGSYSDPDLIYKLTNYRMPYGKHRDLLLIDLPEKYLDWMAKNGFQESELGQLMRIVHETKANGMEHFFEAMRKPGA
jgi:hypothetical protein